MIRLIDISSGHELTVGNKVVINSWCILAIDYVKKKVLLRNKIGGMISMSYLVKI